MAGAKEGRPSTSKKKWDIFRGHWDRKIYEERVVVEHIVDVYALGKLLYRQTDRQTARLGKRCQEDDDDDDVRKPKIHLKCRCPSLGRHTFKPLQLCKYEACVLPHCLNRDTDPLRWWSLLASMGGNQHVVNFTFRQFFYAILGCFSGAHELLSFVAECQQINVLFAIFARCGISYQVT